jgi:3-hydroxyisobutyrate dehydrogenase-like beta-hydroxyacid dehydrogenase
MIRSVALIGAGAMGAPMAWRILRAGFDLTVCDRREEALAPFAAAGAKTTASAADCAGADMIVVIVATPAQMRSVIFEDGGLTSGLPSGHRPILAAMGTVPVEDILAAHDRLAPMGVRVIDAPVSGGMARAAAGALTIIMGGEADDIATARPVFATMGDKLFHCGGVGAGQKVKIVNNIVCLAGTLITAEAYRLGIEQGVDPDMLTQVLDVSTGRNYLTGSAEGVPGYYAALSSSRELFDSIRAIQRKDAHIAAALATGPATDYPTIQALLREIDAPGEITFANWRMVSTQQTCNDPL